MLIPIRLKILASALLLLMLAMAIITGVMAKLFHADKTIYIKDLTAVTATSTQSEVDTLLGSYAGVVRAFGDLLSAPYLNPQQKEQAAMSLFAATPALVAVTVRTRKGSPITLFDRNALSELELTESDVSIELPAAAATSAASSARGITALELSSASHGRTVRVTLQMPQTMVGEFRVDGLVTALARVRSFGATLVDGNQVTLLRNDSSVALPGFGVPALAAGRNATVSEYDTGDDGYFVASTRSVLAPVGLVVTAPRSATNLTARTLLAQLVFTGIALVAVVAIIAMVIARRLSGPIEHLSRAADAVGAGNFDVSVKANSRDEVSQLATSFNTMASNLRERDTRLREANAQLLQSEKMAAIGQLSAGLAHEVKNPLAGILGYAQLTRRSLTDPEVITRNLDVIERETRRCTDIISNLMRFARQEPGERVATDINVAVSRAIALVDHQLGLQKVRIERDLQDGLSPVSCNSNQLQQVVMNLLINAQQVMEPAGGTVHVRTRMSETDVIIEVDDTGPGVPQDVRARIFDPFFTTKQAGKGTGLGLSVSYGLIRDHGGDIRVSDAPGGGARFTISLPTHAGLETGGDQAPMIAGQTA
ncbi:MAG: ATP-binding protein [Gammaproteobacteria bacterium]|nr:ATP-binding protein [Gammaproteobacteria bacterium]